MRLYCEVDVPFDKRSSRNKSSHTLLQRKKKTLYWIWVRTRASIPVPLDFFLSHLMENPDFDIGTCRLFCHIWWRIRAWISVPLVFLFSHLVENLGIDLCTSRRFFLSHLVENPVPLVFLVTNMWSCWWTYKQQTQLLLNVTSFYRGNGIIAC